MTLVARGVVDDALRRLGTAALEWKLGSAHLQVHKAGDEVRVHSRNLNEVTAAVPEIVAAVPNLVVEIAFNDLQRARSIPAAWRCASRG
jgi:DNA ligase-1